MKIPKTARLNEVYVYFRLRERKVGSSQVGEKEQTFAKQILAGPPETKRHYGDSSSRVLFVSSLSATLNFICT